MSEFREIKSMADKYPTMMAKRTMIVSAPKAFSKTVWQQVFLLTVFFFVIASPFMYNLVSKLFKSNPTVVNGVPTTMGLILHTVIFMIVAWIVISAS